jgi:LuxR family maltose regulon positive regulatory protein
MDLEKLLTLLINQLALRKQKLCLVLDDYHVIHDQSIHRVITFLIKHRPSPFKLIVATRTDPPIALNNLRAHSQILELRLADLKFTNVETQEFLNQVMDLNLSIEDVMMLNASTEGWVAGLQMAGLSAQNRGDISTYIRSFSGGNRYILDFLFEEIFSRQTKEIQNFLLKTSILERISSSL